MAVGGNFTRSKLRRGLLGVFMGSERFNNKTFWGADCFQNHGRVQRRKSWF